MVSQNELIIKKVCVIAIIFVALLALSFGVCASDNQLSDIEISNIRLTDADGNIIRGNKDDIQNKGEIYYLCTEISNNTDSVQSVLAIVAVCNDKGAITEVKSKKITLNGGMNIISKTENVVSFDEINVSDNGILKVFLWHPEEGRIIGNVFKATFDGVDKYYILSFGNSYTSDSFTLLPVVGLAGGVQIYPINMYTGSCTISQHYKNMLGEKVYQSRGEYLLNGKSRTVKEVSFDEGFDTNGYVWDFITLHQTGQKSPFFDSYYTEEKPYITRLANYIRQNSPTSEVLFFENWPVYTDRIIEKYEDVYKPIVEGCDKSEYLTTVFSHIKSSYLKAAQTIGNPNRVIPAGEAVTLAVTKYGFTEYVDDTPDYDENNSFVSKARAMYRDKSSHMTHPYGRVLVALTWYEYLTGRDARENSFTYEGVTDEDMVLLKEIAHEACMVSDYHLQ